MNQEYSVVGKSLPRVDGLVKVAGEAKYTADLVLPGMLYGKILRSPYPHARILNIDTTKAEKLPGVKKIITGKNTPGIPYSLIDVPPLAPANDYPLVLDKVRYIGDEVAAVAAIDEDTAQDALDLIKVEYESLPAVFDPEEAIKPGSPRIHDHADDNISWRTSQDLGDIEKGFRKSDHIREDKFVTQVVAHCQMEPHAALASFDSSERLTLWSSTQSPFLVRLGLAQTLGMPESRIRVIKPRVGGGYGGKLEMMNHEFIAALLSKETSCPVKIVLSREELFTATRFRHPMIIELKTGVKKDGTLVARKGKVIFDGGAYNSTGVVIGYLAAIFFTLPYRVPNVRYEILRVFTNNPVSGAMRGFGSPQIHFVQDLQMDMIANDLGIDPVELRLKNALNPNETTPSGIRVTSCGFSECLKKAANMSGWKEKWGKMEEGQGIGIGGSGFLSGSSFRLHEYQSFSTALARANTDGSVLLFTGASDIGEGSDTTLSQIVAEELGIGLEDVHIIAADTEITPLDFGTWSSRITMMGGGAAKEAAFDLKRKLFKVVAEELEANIEDLIAKDKRIYVRGVPEKGVSFAEAVAMCQGFQKGSPVVGNGCFSPEGFGDSDYMELMEKGIGNEAPGYSFAAHVAEVKVDRETGQVKVLKMTTAHDCGKAINPMAVEGQLEGSVQMGMGFALTEEVLRREGMTINPSFDGYKINTSLDMPEVVPIIVESIDPTGPFGAKEAGEGATSPVCPAIANAIYDAIGVRIKDLPITPDKILEALEGKKVKKFIFASLKVFLNILKAKVKVIKFLTSVYRK